MTRCEICKAPAEATCAGLDVPMLGFCLEHAKAHAAACPDVIAGRASVEFHARAPTMGRPRRGGHR